jgi:hypothetical protein
LIRTTPADRRKVRVHHQKRIALLARIALDGVLVFEEKLHGVLPVDWRDQIGKQVVESFRPRYDLRIADSDLQVPDDRPDQVARPVHIPDRNVFDSQPQSGRTEDAISNASVSDLVDSSSERLIQQLNERARMFNPAWLLYVAAVMSLSGLSMLPTVPTVPMVPKLPDVTQPFSAERKSNTLDEYSMLTARYSEPDSILFAEADTRRRPPRKLSARPFRLPKRRAAGRCSSPPAIT